MRKLKLEELNRVDVDEFKSVSRIPVTVVLDNIRSGLNVGSVFRSSDAFAIERIILTGICPKPPHKEIHKTAIGATHSISWEYHDRVSKAIQELKEEGYVVIAIEQTDESIPLRSFEFQAGNKYAVILGNEVDGISDDILPLIDAAIEIKQFGTKHSLNISVATGVVLWKASKDLLT